MSTTLRLREVKNLESKIGKYDHTQKMRTGLLRTHN